jgi:hypothetical protein
MPTPLAPREPRAGCRGSQAMWKKSQDMPNQPASQFSCPLWMTTEWLRPGTSRAKVRKGTAEAKGSLVWRGWAWPPKCYRMQTPPSASSHYLPQVWSQQLNEIVSVTPEWYLAVFTVPHRKPLLLLRTSLLGVPKRGQAGHGAAVAWPGRSEEKPAETVRFSKGTKRNQVGMVN